MTGQIIDISTDKKHLSAQDGFMIVSESGMELARFPLDMIEGVIVSAHGITYTNNLLVRLSEYCVPFVICNQKYFPVSFLLPLEGHYKQGAVMDAQVSASVVLNKRIWQEIVKSKIAMQLSVLQYYQKPCQRLEHLLSTVKSGDSDNVEAQAARFYFQTLFGDDFVRNRDADGINALLNYGYTILRGFVARYLVGAGLHPTLGVHHKNMLNSFRLADDIMEPFRGLIDWLVFKLYAQGITQINSDVKRKLVSLFSQNIRTRLGQTSIPIVIQNLCVSLAKIYLQERDQLDLPYSMCVTDWDGLNASNGL